MSYEHLIDYEHLLFEQIVPNMNLDIHWKPEVQDWIDYNLHYPVYLEAEVEKLTQQLKIDIIFTNTEDAVLFKLFWL
jgi:hypothetical protein